MQLLLEKFKRHMEWKLREEERTKKILEQNNKKTEENLKNEDVLQLHDVRTRYISSSIQVDLHIVVDGSISVRAGHDIADDVRDRIIEEIP